MFRLLAVFAIVFASLSAPLAAKEMPLDERGLGMLLCHNSDPIKDRRTTKILVVGEGQTASAPETTDYDIIYDTIYTPTEIISSFTTEFSETAYRINRDDLTYRYKQTRRGKIRTDTGQCRYLDWERPEISQAMPFEYASAAEAAEDWAGAPAVFPRKSGVYLKNPGGEFSAIAFIDWDRKHLYEIFINRSPQTGIVRSFLHHRRFHLDQYGDLTLWTTVFEYLEDKLDNTIELTVTLCHCNDYRAIAYERVAASPDYAFVLSRLREYAAHFGTDIETLGE